MARPSKLTAEVADRICQAILAGATIETAAAHAGIGASTFYDWIKRGRDGDQHYAEFVDQLDQAVATSEVRDLAIIARAAEEHWQAAAWRLERRFPERYARNRRVEMTGKDGGPVLVQIPTPDKLQAGAAILEQARASNAVSPISPGA
jgi:hypothetical protein